MIDINNKTDLVQFFHGSEIRMDIERKLRVLIHESLKSQFGEIQENVFIGSLIQKLGVYNAFIQYYFISHTFCNEPFIYAKRIILFIDGEDTDNVLDGILEVENRNHVDTNQTLDFISDTCYLLDEDYTISCAKDGFSRNN